MKTMDSIINTPVSIKIKPVKIVINLLIAIATFSSIVIVEFLFLNSHYYFNIYFYSMKIGSESNGIMSAFNIEWIILSLCGFSFYGIITILISYTLCRCIKCNEVKTKKITKRNVLIWVLIFAIYSVFNRFFEAILGTCILPPLIAIVDAVEKFPPTTITIGALYPAAYFTVFCFLLYNVIFRLYHYRKNRLAAK